jgi:predicted nucleic acid-binding protein
MSGRYLLDTNILIGLFADEMLVKSNLAQADEVFIPSIAIGELCYGARKSGRAQENLTKIDELASNSTVLGCDAETARQYGEVKNKLRLISTGNIFREIDVQRVRFLSTGLGFHHTTESKLFSCGGRS